MSFEPGQYVWCKSKCWRYEGLTDYRGFVLLPSLQDDSTGVYADPAKLKPCNAADIDGIEYFLTGKDRLNLPYSPDMLNRSSPHGDLSPE